MNLYLTGLTPMKRKTTVLSVRRPYREQNEKGGGIIRVERIEL